MNKNRNAGQAMPDVKQGKMFLPKHCQVKPDLHFMSGSHLTYKLGRNLMTKNTQGFTLIELLVVVLIIGILASVAIPQYQMAVEKARMVEAILLVKKIAEAQDVFFMANGRYARLEEMESLDISIPATGSVRYLGQNRLQTKDFIYTNEGSDSLEIAVAQRIPAGTKYLIDILSSDTKKIHCRAYPTATNLEKKLCSKLNTNGEI